MHQLTPFLLAASLNSTLLQAAVASSASDDDCFLLGRVVLNIISEDVICYICNCNCILAVHSISRYDL